MADVETKEVPVANLKMAADLTEVAIAEMKEANYGRALENLILIQALSLDGEVEGPEGG